MDVPRDWWKDFFSGLAAELWRAVTTEQQTRAEADLIEKQLRAIPGGRLLDVPCGGGRLALELGARGYRLTGVEFSDAFMAEARAKSAERQQEVEWRQGDMRDLPWQAEFDGAFCFGNSFGYLEGAENLNFLRSVARTLKPGARFVLDTTCSELVLQVNQERTWFEAGGILMLEENSYDLVQGRMNTEYTFIAGERVERKPGSQRLYAFAELSRLLEEAGFGEVQGFGSLDLEPLSLASQRLIVVAARG